MRSLILLLSIGLLTQGRLVPPKESLKSDDGDGEIWAILVAGSNGWWNYRHQADVAHSYHVLVNHGVKKENIITMMYDDVAHHKENPYPGQLFNHPNGSDVYGGVTIDYKRDDVTPKNFLAVLKGDKKASKGKKVLNTNEKDRIFVFFSDHGAPGLVAFPSEVLTVKELSDTLKEMHQKKLYKELVFYLEACESGSMFDSSLHNDINVFAVTAANGHESSWAAYCSAKKGIDTCLGDEFSVNWMEDSDKENLLIETLFTQFKIINEKTEQSHVCRFGDFKISQEPVADFQGKQTSHPVEHLTSSRDYKLWPSRDVPLRSLEAKLMRNGEDQAEIQEQINAIKAKREVMFYDIKAFVKKLVPSGQGREMQRASILRDRETRITKFECHHDLVHAFNKICYPFHQSPYATNFVHVLVNLCEAEIPTPIILDAMMDHCLDSPVKNVL